MKVAKAHCLFEQSGVFRDAFIRNGTPAECYDISNDFGKTDHVVDIFSEIEKAYGGGGSLFDGFSKDDVIMAFFPCTRFEAQISLWFKGAAYAQRKWSAEEKLMHSMKLQGELTELYTLLSKMCIVCIRKRLRLIVENPKTPPHYLTQYWPLKPAVIDNDRSLNGDVYKKPTQYWFIGCSPENNIMVDCQTERKVIHSIDHRRKNEGEEGQSTKVLRSMLNPAYANWFVRTYVLTL